MSKKKMDAILEAQQTIRLIQSLIKEIPDESVTPEQALFLLQLALKPRPKLPEVKLEFASR